jgi:phosphatidylserine/phosphatidylglycerophosphate/cardiolipin synthase-like enzyme
VVYVKKYISISAFLLLILVIGIQTGNAMDLTLSKDSSVQVYFSPRGECTDAIVSEIDHSKTEILVQAYSFTSSPIAKALASANKRGVKVLAILDKSQRTERYTSATFLTNTSIPTFIDDKHAIAHNKIMIIDKAKVITGSFNFTKAAEEKNAENLLVISSKELASYYLDNWQKHREHSVPYGRL